MLLSPQGITEGDLIGTRNCRTALGGPVEARRGLAHLGDGAAGMVTVLMV